MKTTRPAAAERPDDDNPPLTRAELRRARPAAEVLPKLIGETAATALLRRPRGRPIKPDKKVNQTLRIDPDVLEAYRQQGRGWQTRINQVLRENMPPRHR